MTDTNNTNNNTNIPIIDLNSNSNCLQFAPIEKKNKTIRNRNGLIFTKKIYKKNYMKSTLSSSNKKNVKYELTTPFTRMDFSTTTTPRATSTTSYKTKNRTQSSSSLNSGPSMYLTKSYQWGDNRVYSDNLNHFNKNDISNFGTDPYGHFG